MPIPTITDWIEPGSAEADIQGAAREITKRTQQVYCFQ